MRPSEQLGIDCVEESWLAYQWDRAVFYWGRFVDALLSERTKPDSSGHTHCKHDIDAVLGLKKPGGRGGRRAVNVAELVRLDPAASVPLPN
jgi:hypothetical protein